LKEYLGSIRDLTPHELCFFPFKILSRIGESFENGTYFSPSIFIRKEIWNQTNARITGLHQKYEAYNTIYQKIDNLSTLSSKGVINLENIDRFCDILIDVQNTFSKEFNFVKASNFQTKNVFVYYLYKDISQYGFYKKFGDLSMKIKSNILSIKLSSKPDFLEVLLKLIKKSGEIGNYYNIIIL